MMNSIMLSMLRLQKCPMCGIRALECYPYYGNCHECDYVDFRKKRKVKPKSPYLPHSVSVRFGDVFTKEDHKVVRKALLSIPAKEQRVVILRFWKRTTKQEISEKLGISIDRVELILASSLERLRTLCLKNPRFSRALEKLEELAA